MKTREQYEDALHRFHEFGRGKVEEVDFFPAGEPAYRHLTLEVREGDIVAAQALASALVVVAIETGAAMSAHIFAGKATLSLSISRALDATEVAGAPALVGDIKDTRFSSRPVRSANHGGI